MNSLKLYDEEEEKSNRYGRGKKRSESAEEEEVAVSIKKMNSSFNSSKVNFEDSDDEIGDSYYGE